MDEEGEGSRRKGRVETSREWKNIGKRGMEGVCFMSIINSVFLTAVIWIGIHLNAGL